MHGIERFLQDFHKDFELLRVSYRFESQPRRFTVGNLVGRGWFLLRPVLAADRVFILPGGIDPLQGSALESGSNLSLAVSPWETS